MRIFVALFLCVMGWLCAPPVHAADSCEAGYFLNDNGECEICPPGYWCCEEGLVYENLYVHDGCVMYGIPPGQELIFDIREKVWDLRDCPSGSYCPGTSDAIFYYVPKEVVILNAISCGFGYSPSGSDDVNDCVSCPDMPSNTMYAYGFAGLASDTIESCTSVLIFTDDEVMGQNMLAVYALLMDAEIFLNSDYRPGHQNNKNVLRTIGLMYDPDKEMYVFDGQTFNAGCAGGYYLPMTESEMEIEIVPGYPLEDLLQITTCEPVGTGFWSPDYHESSDFVDTWFRNPCPNGTFTMGYGGGADAETDCCVSGMASYDNACVPMCAAGIGHIHVGGDVSIPLFAERLTTPALNVMYNGTVCYANAASGAAAGTINIRLSDGAIYHLVK